MTETETRPQAAAEGEGATGSRRKLTEDQEREVTRLYAETETPVSEISKRFGIGESSVYRVAQRHGAKLRGRTSTTAGGGSGARGGRRGGARAAATTAAASTTTGTGTGRRGRRAGTAAAGAARTAAAGTTT